MKVKEDVMSNLMLFAGIVYLFFFPFNQDKANVKVKKMNEIAVKKLTFKVPKPGLRDVAKKMNEACKKHSIDVTSWKEYDYKPEVKFSIAHNDKEIYLKYFVREKYLRALNTKSNSSVWEDSCVEFFVSPADDGIYYNFEFNCIGTGLIGSGTSRSDHAFLNTRLMDKIRRFPTLESGPFKEKKGDFYWELTITIPVEVFIKHDIRTLGGRKFRANFYKCGDKLTEPHFLSWKKIETEKPDFHRPEYFGVIVFEK